MADFTYKQAESLIRPSEIDNTSSPDGVFIRKNIQSVEAEDSAGNTYTKYTYDEAFLTFGEYESYKNSIVSEAVTSMTIRRESEIIDDYTLQLMEEGVI